MVEPGGTKQVRVDNWGIFFLQRLQLFFSKTDYCDLTLQFEGNVQLKVHRLVMNACTEYFSFLEQTCPAMEENTILMPSDMQADVIVPIVNFMYTGMLEFHFAVFDKIYKAAETMNIGVLIKILEAQVGTKPQAVGNKKKAEISNSFGQGNSKKAPVKTPHDLGSNKKQPAWNKRRVGSSTVHPVSATFNEKWSTITPPQDPLSLPDNTPKPTRFEWPDDDLPTINLMDISFDEISYTSKPLMTREEEQRAGPSFDDVRDSAINNRKKSSVSESSSNLNMQEVEDYVREQKVRTDLNVFDPEENVSPLQGVKRKTDVRNTSSPKRAKLNEKDSNIKETTVNIKANTSAELDHTKIVSEILKKYPGLVKKNKNIKLKIMATSNKSANSEQTKSQAGNTKKGKKQMSPPPSKNEIKTEPVSQTEIRETKKVSEDGPWTCTKCVDGEESPEFVLYYLYRKHMSDVHDQVFDKRYCRYCGKFCSTDALMAYHLYAKHGLKPPSNMTFPRCSRCPYIAISEQKMLQHQELHSPDTVQCSNCKLGFISRHHLNLHIQLSGHLNKNSFNLIDCAYCMKKLQSGVNLLNHVKTHHFKEAKRDGIVCLEENLEIDDLQSEEEKDHEGENHNPDDEESEYILPVNIQPSLKKGQLIQKDKVKIISDVKVPSQQEEEDENAEPPRQLDPSSEAEALNNVATGIATSLGLVDIVVLDENQQYILQQQQNQNETEFILPELSSDGSMLQANQDINSTDELVMVLADQDYPDGQNQENSDNSNIVVLYSHPVDGQQGQFITSQGNLMVNSQTGMLEIRNGSTIATTTANQVLSVSNSHDSPGESIELIQREIESHNTEEVNTEAHHKETVEQDFADPLSQEEAAEPKESVTEVHVSVITEEEEEELNKSVDTADVITSADVTDHSEEHLQDEPMEITEEPAVIETSEIVEKTSEHTEIEAEKDEHVTAETLTTTEEGHDIPPEVGQLTHIEHPTSELITTTASDVISRENSEVLFTEGGNAVILNDVDHVNTSGETESSLALNDLEENNVTDAEHNLMMHTSVMVAVASNDLEELQQAEVGHEDMEVDGAGGHVEESGNIEENQPGSVIIEKNEETIVEATEELGVPQTETDVHSLETQVSNDLEEKSEFPEEHNQQNDAQDEPQDIRIEDIPLPPEPQITRPISEVSESPTSNLNNSEEIRPQNDAVEEESQSSQEPDTQEDEASRHHEETRATAEINRTILEDWGEDTDSQQSHSEKQKNAINKEAVENVSKLMDDWDEEEEDEKRKE